MSEAGELRVRVARRWIEAEDIVGLELVAAGGAKLPRFDAGAHIDVHVPGGVVRQYSLSNDPADEHRYVLGILREPASRGGSSAMHDRVAEGDELVIGGPRNLFPLDESAPFSLLVAGGIGITPMLSMARRLESIGADFALHHCTRSAARTPFASALADARFAGRVHHHRDDGPTGQLFEPSEVLASVSPDAHLYVCGPAGFMDWVLDAADAAGWGPDRLHSESFGGPAPGSAPTADTGDGFEVVIRSSGAVVAVPDGVTVHQALAAEGIVVPLSCEQGICGTCVVGVVEGVPDHRDMFLLPDEQAANDRFTPCCSRSKSARLVLDL